MDRPTFIEVLGYLVKLIVVIFTVIFLVDLLISHEAFVEVHAIEKFTVELKENIVNSELTTEHLVFSAAALQEHNGAVFEPVRTCKYIYYVKIECIDKEKCENYGIAEKYTFGSTYVQGGVMSSGVKIPQKTSDFPVLIESASGRVPASMSITVSDDPLGRLSCMIEKAYRTKTIQTETCILKDFNGKCGLKASAPIALRKTGNAICDVRSTGGLGTPNYIDTECKYLPDIQLADFLYPLDTDFKGKKYLKVVPARTGSAPETFDCPSNLENFVAGEGESVIVFICGGDEK